jgi:D-alanyl-D-alanine carboxypeptidase (penicillin-binding protein 5/6)
MTTAQVSTAGGRSFVFENTNALLGRLPGAIGVKSGFTSKAGQCIAAAAERNGVRVLLVMLNARNRWWDAHGMMERAFALAQP